MSSPPNLSLQPLQIYIPDISTVLGDFFLVPAHTLLHLGLNQTSISTQASPLSLTLGCSLAPLNDLAAILKGLHENGSKTGRSYSIFIPSSFCVCQ